MESKFLKGKNRKKEKRKWREQMGTYSLLRQNLKLSNKKHKLQVEIDAQVDLTKTYI